MQKITFKIQGSEPDPYDVTFIKDNSNLFCTCTCKAGKNNTHCKHRLRILQGNPEAIVGENVSEVNTVASWLPGTQLDKAMLDYQNAELEFEIADKKRKKALKVIGYVMNPQ
ncbi:MAG TPA: SWIM zinc finger family protein [Opitutales bacterium]|jgi:hypothetical protein|nr:SWIM zinc finger family protein [Opitutales bacterium]